MMNKRAFDRAMERYEPDTNGGCWLWTRGINVGGYAVISHNNRQKVVHKLVFEEINGPVEKGLLVCHKCDVRSCINPDHLFVGTYADNTNDMYSKGRGTDRRGEKHPLAKLDADKVREIRSLLASGSRQRHLAKKYGVCASTIGGIAQNTRWTHV